MSESTLSVDYQTLVREAVRKFGNGWAYSEGTVTVAAGVVTLTGGTWPTWSAQCAIQIGDVVYSVTERTSAAALVATTGTLSVTDSRYVLVTTSKEDKYLGLVEIRDSINSALRKFYAPHMVEVRNVTKTIDSAESPSPQTTSTIISDSSPHIWSFLRPSYSFTTAVGSSDYDLPDNCGQQTGEWIIYVGGVPMPMGIMSDGHLASTKRQGNGIPRYVSVHPKGEFDAAVGQRFEVLLDVNPDAAYTITFNYNVIPESLNPTNRYPMGGALHSQAILAGVLAELERVMHCEGGAAQQEYERQLQASLYLDREVKDAEDISYQVDAPDMGTYEWLLQEVAAATGDNPNYRCWNWTTASKINSYIQRGLKMFERPEVSPVPTHKGHKWSFLRPQFRITFEAPYSTGTVTVADGLVTLSGGQWPTWAERGSELNLDGYRYRVLSVESNTTLRIDSETVDAAAGSTYVLEQNYIRMMPGFDGMDSPLMYERGGFQPMRSLTIQLVSFTQLRHARQVWGTSNATQPMLATILPAKEASGLVYRELLLWPAPGEGFSVFGTAKISMGQLVPGNYIPCDPSHYDTVLSACIAAAVPRRWAEFVQKLAASIEVDQAEHAPHTVGANLDRSDRRYDDRSRWWRREGPLYINGVRQL